MVNFEEFQYLMYRPLYWFGNGASPTLNTSLSLADPPEYNGNKVTITMKRWKWSNGENVTAEDVVFWIHMMQAVAQTDWGAFVPGLFPTQHQQREGGGPPTLTMTMDKQYNPTWFTYNELSQLTPMPMAWDKTAGGPSDCTANGGRLRQGLQLPGQPVQGAVTWVGSSRMWSVVDGPWQLQSFNSDGNSTFVPNKSYSGPVKPTLARFEELPFTTESAEYNVLQAAGRQRGRRSTSATCRRTTRRPSRPTRPSAPTRSTGTRSTRCTSGASTTSRSTSSPPPATARSSSSCTSARRSQYLMNQQAIISGPLRGYGCLHGRAGRDLPGEPVPVGEGQGRATRSRSTPPRPRSC